MTTFNIRIQQIGYTQDEVDARVAALKAADLPSRCNIEVVPVVAAEGGIQIDGDNDEDRDALCEAVQAAIRAI